MALIAMAVYSTAENKKDECLRKTLDSLERTINFGNHRLFLSINGETEDTRIIIQNFELSVIAQSGCSPLTVITNKSNLGTAEAINMAWKHRVRGENAIKMDDDVVIHSKDWIEEMEEAIRHEPKIGIVGLKRKDLIEHPDRTDFYKSKLVMLPHNPGERWIITEEVNHVMGTCQMYSSALLDKIGYLWQPKLYGFDDSLAAIRCRVAGFKNVFLPHIEIDHIDEGATPFQAWKEKVAMEEMGAYNKMKDEYMSGKTSIYYNPFK